MPTVIHCAGTAGEPAVSAAHERTGSSPSSADIPALVRAVSQLTLENQQLRDTTPPPAAASSRSTAGCRPAPRLTASAGSVALQPEWVRLCLGVYSRPPWLAFAG